MGNLLGDTRCNVVLLQSFYKTVVVVNNLQTSAFKLL
jgi:hypothetical protein